MTRFILPIEKHEHARPCQPCKGTGVTGERYEMPAGEHILLVEVICPACDGCGNGDPDHPGCKVEWHADPDGYVNADDESDAGLLVLRVVRPGLERRPGLPWRR